MRYVSNIHNCRTNGKKRVEILYKIDLSSKGVNLSLICIFKYSIIIKSIYINLV